MKNVTWEQTRNQHMRHIVRYCGICGKGFQAGNSQELGTMPLLLRSWIKRLQAEEWLCLRCEGEIRRDVRSTVARVSEGKLYLKE